METPAHDQKERRAYCVWCGFVDHGEHEIACGTRNTEPLTTADAIALLNAIPESDGGQQHHEDADAILLRCLRTLGYGDVATAYHAARERAHFWYA